MLWPIMQEGGEDPVETLAAQLKEARKELTTTKINHEAQARLCLGFLFAPLRACAQGAARGSCAALVALLGVAGKCLSTAAEGDEAAPEANQGDAVREQNTVRRSASFSVGRGRDAMNGGMASAPCVTLRLSSCDPSAQPYFC